MKPDKMPERLKQTFIKAKSSYEQKLEKITIMFSEELEKIDWEKITKAIYSKTEHDVLRALGKEHCDVDDFMALISSLRLRQMLYSMGSRQVLWDYRMRLWSFKRVVSQFQGRERLGGF